MIEVHTINSKNRPKILKLDINVDDIFFVDVDSYIKYIYKIVDCTQQNGILMHLTVQEIATPFDDNLTQKVTLVKNTPYFDEIFNAQIFDLAINRKKEVFDFIFGAK